MSRETAEWLNRRVLVGFTEKRGDAWHYRAELQGTESNHYAGAIPVADAIRRIFNWSPIPAVMSATYDTTSGPVTVAAEDRMCAVRPAGGFGPEDPGAVLGAFKAGYKVHGFDEWLLQNVDTIAHGGVELASVGLLRKGAVGWAQFELAETMTSKVGIDYRPFIVAGTSCDGTMATQYGRGATVVVCDNTYDAFRAESAASGQVVKLRHTKESLGKIQAVRDSLSILVSDGEQFGKDIDKLSKKKVSDAVWSAFIQSYFPIGDDASKRGVTMAENARETVTQLYKTDPMCAPFKGTEFGVVQTISTYAHHHAIVRGSDNVERNAERMLKGGNGERDANTLRILQSVR